MNKNYGLLGILLLVLGIAVGWISRGAAGNGGGAEPKVARETPAPKTPASAGTAESTAENSAEVQGKRAIRESSPKKAENSVKVFEPDSEEMKQMRSQMVKAMAGRQRAKFQRQIDKLAESLSLTNAQKANLTKWLDERVAKLETADIHNLGNDDKADELMKSLTNKGLEEQLAASLTEDQKAAFTGFKERETQGKVDSMALKSLSQMQGVIEFEEGQRDEVYKILSETAAEKLQRQNEKVDPSSLFADGMGFEMDPYDLGIQEAMQESFADMGKSGAAMDQKAIGENMRRIIDERIEQKVEKLRPVLNDKQLEQYRSELKNKGGGMFGGAVIGGGVIGGTSISVQE